MTCLKDHPDGVIVVVTVTTGGRTPAFASVDSDSVRVLVGGEQVGDHTANEAVLLLMAETASVDLDAVSMVAGACTRRKRVLVRGLSASDLAARFELVS